jgi:hypothetical protein
VLVLRQVDQHAAGDRHLRRQSRALAAHRVLDHLHEDALALRRAGARSGAAVRRSGAAPDVGDVQEGGPAEPDVDERRLHPGQDAHDASEIDIADEAAAGAALDVQFLDDALVHDGDARFLRGEVDQDLFGHGRAICNSGVRFAGYILPSPPMSVTLLSAPELLAPAGSLAMLRTALAFGADAVYAGQPRYSLRVRNNDFGKLEQALASAIRRGACRRQETVRGQQCPAAQRARCTATSPTWRRSSPSSRTR